ncbi:MlaE family ABC transporter permease [Alicycliphilus denitrificans]|uniref:MlaE family ABC transporter permease n=1 Tax=Alicycliphilus denitrificans TaxID=179636 RepID=UPI00384E6422
MIDSLYPAPLARRAWALARRWALAWWRIIDLGAVVLVLLCSPSSYRRAARARLAQQIYTDTVPILAGFTALAALLSLVITHIVVVTALSYGLTRYALEMVIRVLVLELIPLTAALFVAMRTTIPGAAQLAQLRRSGALQALRAQGGDPVRMEFLPRVLAGAYASVTLAALSCVVALVMAYLGVYGLTTAGLPAYTRMFGQVFTPSVTLVFALKTLLSSLAVALIPMASSLYPAHSSALQRRHAAGQGGLARLFAVLLLIELVSLLGNYY